MRELKTLVKPNITYEMTVGDQIFRGCTVRLVCHCYIVHKRFDMTVTLDTLNPDLERDVDHHFRVPERGSRSGRDDNSCSFVESSGLLL